MAAWLGRASCLCEDGGHPLPVQPHGHGRGQLPGHKDAARRKAAQICLPPAQQRPQQTALQIPDVRSPQAHPLILQPLKQPDISAEHGVHRRLSGLPLLDGPVQLELQLRVPKHGDLAGEDGRLTFPGPDPHPLGQGGGLPLHLAGRRPQAGPLVLHPGVPSSGAVRRRRPETDRRAHPTPPEAPIPRRIMVLISSFAVLPTPRSPGTRSVPRPPPGLPAPPLRNSGSRSRFPAGCRRTGRSKCFSH